MAGSGAAGRGRARPPRKPSRLTATLAAANPAYLPDLATALNNLGIRYSGVGRRADAVAPDRGSRHLCAGAGRHNPAYLPDLAMALNNLGIRYSEVGRRDDAVAPTEEAVTLYRDAGRRPTPPTCPTSPRR